jgi:hypothetical protein
MPSYSLVVLRNLYILGAVFAEHEAEPPLLVDADAVLPLAICRERLEPIARRSTQIIQAHRGIKLLQFRERALLMTIVIITALESIHSI